MDLLALSNNLHQKFTTRVTPVFIDNSSLGMDSHYPYWTSRSRARALSNDAIESSHRLGDVTADTTIVNIKEEPDFVGSTDSWFSKTKK